MDYGLAVLATALQGGGQVSEHLPPWYDNEPEDDMGIVAALQQMAGKRKD